MKTDTKRDAVILVAENDLEQMLLEQIYEAFTNSKGCMEINDGVKALRISSVPLKKPEDKR